MGLSVHLYNSFGSLTKVRLLIVLGVFLRLASASYASAELMFLVEPLGLDWPCAILASVR